MRWLKLPDLLNNERQHPDKDGNPTFPSAIRVNGGFFRPIMTQSMSVKSLVYEIQKYIYVPFHFIPGDSNQPIDGKISTVLRRIPTMLRNF
jgi:hypothetical protein